MMTRSVKRFAGLVVAGLAATTVLAAAGSAAAAVAPQAGELSGRGRLVSAVPRQSLAKPGDVVSELTAAGFDAGSVRYGVDTYQLTYRTVDPEGQPTTASGLLALPRGAGRLLRTVSYTHGSEVFRGDAPSVATGWASAPAITYASAGFAAVAPDYLGLGVGPGAHPWMHKPSEVTAALDMLRAARELTARTGRVLTRNVLVTGFSQGASAATALGRALQDGVDAWFGLSALAAISGAYDLRGAELPALLHGDLNPKWSVGYTAYLLVAWNRLHHLYNRPDEVFWKPAVAELFDSEHRGEVVFAGLPDTVGELLTPRGRQLLEQPTGRLAEALEVADSTCSWQPRVPVRLYVAVSDDQATPLNTVHCQAQLHAPVHQLGDVGHLGSNIAGTADVVRWFTTLQ